MYVPFLLLFYNCQKFIKLHTIRYDNCLKSLDDNAIKELDQVKQFSILDSVNRVFTCQSLKTKLTVYSHISTNYKYL